MDEIGLLKVRCYLLCSMPPHLYSVPANYQSRNFLGLIFFNIFYFELLDVANLILGLFFFFSTCNVQTYKIQNLGSCLVAIIKTSFW